MRDGPAPPDTRQTLSPPSTRCMRSTAPAWAWRHPVSIASTVLRETPERERGSAVGVLSAFYDLFVGVSSFGAGAVASRFGYWAAFVMAAVALGAAAIAGRFVFFGGKAEATIADEDRLLTRAAR